MDYGHIVKVDNWRILRTDDRNLELQEYRLVASKKGKPAVKKWCWYGYFSNLQDACREMLERKMSIIVKAEVEDVLAAIAEARDAIVDAINNPITGASQ